MEQWWSERAVPVTHAVEALLDEMEGRAHVADGPDARRAIEDVLPLSTGLMVLDRVLGGGVRRGRVVVVEAEIPAQANALICSVARGLDHRTLFDSVHAITETVGWLLAGATGIPAVAVAAEHLSSSEWEAIAGEIRRLVDQNLLISATGTVGGLEAVVAASGVDVVLVDQAGRFGPTHQVLPGLCELASTRNVAVVATSGPQGELPDWVDLGMTRVGMHGYELGGRASLVRFDPEELLSVAHVEVDCLSGVIT